jgi:hypothetical protein
LTVLFGPARLQGGFLKPRRNTLRNDMTKVLKEAPRVRPRKAGKGVKPRHPEDGEAAPTRQAMRAAHREVGRAKVPALRQSVLRRALLSQVGRPWDSVYSELSRALGPLLEWALFEVATRTSVHEGKVLAHDMLGEITPIEQGWYRFYVRPLSRTLERAPPRPKYRPPPQTAPVRLTTADGRHLRWLHNTWFEVRLEPLPVPKEARYGVDLGVRDVVLGRNVGSYDRGLLRELYGAEVYARAKRQLSSRERSRLGL